MIKAAYIHIPFCHHICHYCDFNKFLMDRQPVNEYLESLGKEMEMAGVQPGVVLDSVFVGGGTPTALSVAQLERLVELISTQLTVNGATEYTFEANPGDLTKEKLMVLKQAGVNRLSFGVQSFNDELLKSIGRGHRAADIYTSVENALEAGFENISLDLIYSLPGQTFEDFKDTLDKALELKLPHYSGYSLIIEPKTVFYNLMNKGKLRLPGEDEEARMYEVLMDRMEKNGLTQYEISNFATPGFESRHNLTYWNNEEYYGFGAGAHGYVDGCRRSNHGPLKKYMGAIENGKPPILEMHKVNKKEQMEEEMFLGLRKVQGVSIRKFMTKYGEDPLSLFKEEIGQLTSRGLLEICDGRLRLTRQGRLLGNEVFQAFLV